MSEDDPDEIGTLLLSLLSELKEMNIRVGTLRYLLSEHLGISDAQYAAALAQVTAAATASAPGTKH